MNRYNIIGVIAFSIVYSSPYAHICIRSTCHNDIKIIILFKIPLKLFCYYKINIFLFNEYTIIFFFRSLITSTVSCIYTYSCLVLRFLNIFLCIIIFCST